MNDTERRQWCGNDEGLYSWWKLSRKSLTAFVREHRAEIDECVRKVTSGEQPAHFLRYGGRAER